MAIPDYDFPELFLEVLIMTPEVISTRDLPIGQQFDACKSWFAPVFEIATPDDPAKGYLSESSYWAMDGFAISQVDAPSVRNTRTSTLVRRNPIDHWALTIGQKATAISTADDSFVVPAQTPFLVSVGREFASERAADKRLQFYLPRDTFSHLAGQLDATTGLSLSGGLGRLLRDFLLNVRRSLSGFQASDLPHVTAAVRAMIGACVVPTPDRLTEASSMIAATQRGRIQQFVRQHLSSPDLGVPMLCAALGISRSELYRLLQPEGGVARYIQRQRLERCRALLSDVTTSASIASVAAGMGFDEPAHFSRAFRREFGMTPTDMRISALENLSGGPERSDPSMVTLGNRLSALIFHEG